MHVGAVLASASGNRGNERTQIRYAGVDGVDGVDGVGGVQVDGTASFSDDTSNESKNLVKSAEPLDKTK